MLQFFAGKMESDRNWIWLMLTVTSDKSDKNGSDAIATGSIISNVEVALRTLEANADRYQMSRTIERLERINHCLSNRDQFPITLGNWLHQLNELISAINKDLEEKLFLYVPPEFVKYYDQDDLFGIKDKFPKANEEIKFAGNCYATDNYTACVFHLMRAVEISAKRMVYKMKVQHHLSKPIELCDWGQLISALEEGLKVLRIGSRTTIRQKNKYEFFNQSVGHFRNLKDAWRNNVSHSRKIYLQGETTDIINNTRSFFTHLAKKVKE